jgi:hypothetical protein
MFSLNIFIILLFIIGVTAAFLVFYTAKNMNKGNINKIEKIPRNVLLGVIFAIIDILWCTPQAVEIFSQSSGVMIWSIAIAALVIGCCFLDYLFARALAGFLILLAHYFLRASFAVDLPLMWLFSIACLLLGVAGIFFGGMPHLFRDLLRKLCNSVKWKTTFVALFSVYTVLMLGAALFLVVK